MPHFRVNFAASPLPRGEVMIVRRMRTPFPAGLLGGGEETASVEVSSSDDSPSHVVFNDQKCLSASSVTCTNTTSSDDVTRQSSAPSAHSPRKPPLPPRSPHRPNLESGSLRKMRGNNEPPLELCRKDSDHSDAGSIRRAACDIFEEDDYTDRFDSFRTSYDKEAVVDEYLHYSQRYAVKRGKHVKEALPKKPILSLSDGLLEGTPALKRMLSDDPTTKIRGDRPRQYRSPWESAFRCMAVNKNPSFQLNVVNLGKEEMARSTGKRAYPRGPRRSIQTDDWLEFARISNNANSGRRNVFFSKFKARIKAIISRRKPRKDLI